MVKTRKQLREYWDNLILRSIPPHANFQKVEAELREHYSLLKMAWKRVLLPLVFFYVIIGLILKIHFFGSLFISLLAFIYSNLLPDADILIKKRESFQKESLWYEKYFLLCFAPVVLYYVLQGRATPLYSSEHRPFHNIRSAFLWSLFLLIIGSLFWPESTLKKLMLPVFGLVGFSFHLAVDGALEFLRLKRLIGLGGIGDLVKNKFAAWVKK